MSNGKSISQSKYWCYTINNYNDDDITALKALVTSGTCTYIVFGYEVGEEKTPHIQGYAEFSSRRRFNAAKQLINRRAHLEARRGNAREASDYCKKDGSYFEDGEISASAQGKRTDLLAVQTLVQSGASKRRIVEEHFGTYVKYHKGIDAARMVLSATRDRNEAPEVLVFWGETGTGKTRKVYDDNENIYTHPGGPWFDGYDGQEIALFDDFGGSEFKLTYLLKLLDRYPMKVPIKGSFVEWCPKKIYLTSNMDPETWYANANPEHVAALRRRFTTVQHFTTLQ